MEACLIRAGLRLRWLGDGSGRLTVRDLAVMCEAWAADEESPLFRALHPGHIPTSTRLQIDQINLAWAAQVQVAKAFGAKPKFKPLYAPEGSMWADMGDKTTKVLDGQYLRMSPTETLDWLRSLPAWRGKPLPQLSQGG